MTLEPGDIVVVPFPYTDKHATKSRPALVLSARRYNETHDDVIVCAMTSNLRNAEYSVLVTQADMAAGALHRTSRIKAGKIQTLHAATIKRVAGRLHPQVLDQVRKEIASLLT